MTIGLRTLVKVLTAAGRVIKIIRNRGLTVAVLLPRNVSGAPNKQCHAEHAQYDYGSHVAPRPEPKSRNTAISPRGHIRIGQSKRAIQGVR